MPTTMVFARFNSVCASISRIGMFFKMNSALALLFANSITFLCITTNDDEHSDIFLSTILCFSTMHAVCFLYAVTVRAAFVSDAVLFFASCVAAHATTPVSYTHLTLPTNREV